MRKAAWIFAMVFSLPVGAHAAVNPLDVAFDKMAHKLELLRNQMELTVRNHSASPSDIRRQGKDIAGMGIFTRVPLATQDRASDRQALAALREDFGGALSGSDGPRLQGIRFSSPWKVAPRRVPKAIPFDQSYRLPEEQVVDRRELELRFTVPAGTPVPKDPKAWLASLSREGHLKRLVEPTPANACSVRGRGLICKARIYRFRDVRYPEFLSPDLGNYTLPSEPKTESQKASARRIEKYRADIARLWPEVQPYLNGIREFAVNDARVGFFIRHMK